MKMSVRIILCLVYLSAILLSACVASPLRLQPLPDFSDAYSITIIDKWAGLSPTAPMDCLYTLESPMENFGPDNFQGSALFSVGAYSGDAKTGTAAISVPISIIKSFLQKLSQAAPENGKYVPSTQWTDDYPEITIRLVYDNAQVIEFYTASQGEEHIPWEVTYNGNSYIINSGIPMQAMSPLKPYLAQDVLDNLEEQVK